MDSKFIEEESYYYTQGPTGMKYESPFFKSPVSFLKDLIGYREKGAELYCDAYGAFFTWEVVDGGRP